MDEKQSCKNCIHAFSGFKKDGQPEIMCSALKGFIDVHQLFNEEYNYCQIPISVFELAKGCKQFITLTEAHKFTNEIGDNE